jgi:cell division transport system permease protein
VSLNLLYSFREGMRGLRRARLASFVTVSTIAVTLILFDLFMVLTVNVRGVVRSFRARMALEVFIDPAADSSAVAALAAGLRAIPGVSAAAYVSPERALERFRTEFGEDPLALLGENPLPASFQVAFSPEARNADRAEAVVAAVEALPLVDEVVYHGRFFRAVEKYSRTVILVDLALVALVSAASLFLVANTLRLTLHAQGKTIQIMRLVGATDAFVRRPYLVQGVVQGFLGGAVCGVVVWGLLKVFAWRYTLSLEGMAWFFWAPVCIGTVLGWMGSVLGLGKYLKDERVRTR